MAAKAISNLRWNVARSETLPVPLTSPTLSPGQKFESHYIVVHGLQDASSQEVDYQVALERCVENIAKRADGSHRVHNFRFRTSPLLLDGGEEGFKSTVSKLRRDLDEIRRFEFRAINQSTSHEEGPIPFSRFIFITHGLGSWLVKAVLVKEDLALHTLGLLFLDPPRISIYSSSSRAYADAIIELGQKFHDPSPSPTAEPSFIPESLLAALWITDGNFQEYQRETSEQGIKGALDPYFVDLWRQTPESSEGTATTKLTQTQARSSTVSRIHKLIQPPPTTAAPTPPNEDEVWERVDDLPKRLREPAVNAVGCALARDASDLTQVPLITSTAGNSSALAKPIWEDLEKEGQLWLARGKLENARTAFKAALDTLETPTFYTLGSVVNSGLLLRHAEIRVQITIIDYRCGDTDDADKPLRALERKIEQLPRVLMSGEDRVRLSGLKKEVQRRLGAWLLSRGRYPEAIKTLKMAASSWLDANNRADHVTVCKAQRDLAVAYGLVGDFVEAHKTIHLLGVVRPDSVPGPLSAPKPEMETEKLWAAAHVAMFAGQHNWALEASTKLFRLRQRSLGGRHIKTLKAANLRAYLLACTFQLETAREECGSTLQALSEDFGSTHRQTLEAIWVLVVIFRKYRSFAEATATGESLNGLADESFTQKDHPMRLKSKAELAHSYSADGRNERAKELLEEVVKLSGCRLQPGGDGRRHEILTHYADRSAPGMCRAAHAVPALEYQIKLARVHWAMGDWQAAQERALHVLQTQRERRDTNRHLREKGETPRPESDKESGNRGSVAGFIDGVLSDIDRELDRSDGQGNSCSGPWIQASTFAALRLLALIQSNQNVSTHNEMQPLRILDTVQRWQAQASVFGAGSLGLLATMHDHAVILRGYQKIPEARECFKTVFVARARRLGIPHLATLSTKRELVVTECLMKNWVDPESFLSEDATRDENQADGDVGGELPLEAEGMSDEGWHAVETCFLDILQEQDCYLGADHPESLQTMLWVLAVQLQRNAEGRVSKTHELLNHRLRSPGRGGRMNLSQKEIEGIENQAYELYAAKEYSKIQHSEAPKDQKLHETPDMNSAKPPASNT